MHVEINFVLKLMTTEITNDKAESNVQSPVINVKRLLDGCASSFE